MVSRVCSIRILVNLCSTLTTRRQLLLTIQEVLRAHHGHGALDRDDPSHIQRLPQHLLSPALHHLADKAQRLCFVCAEFPSRQSEFTDEGLVARDLGETLEGANVRC